MATFSAPPRAAALTSTTALFFKYAPDGTFNPLFSFNSGDDGWMPLARLVRDGNGNLYGTTWVGGSDACGVVFRVEPNGTETVLHDFGSGDEGCHLKGGLVRDKQGNLYGTTNSGGANQKGVVFMLAPDGTYTVLHNFGAKSTDGANPTAGLVEGEHGVFYGTTYSGGANGLGTIYSITSDGTEKVLHSFDYDSGFSPSADLTVGKHGVLYGTTYYGGAYGGGIGQTYHDGVVFSLSKE